MDIFTPVFIFIEEIGSSWYIKLGRSKVATVLDRVIPTLWWSYLLRNCGLV